MSNDFYALIPSIVVLILSIAVGVLNVRQQDRKTKITKDTGIRSSKETTPATLL